MEETPLGKHLTRNGKGLGPTITPRATFEGRSELQQLQLLPSPVLSRRDVWRRRLSQRTEFRPQRRLDERPGWRAIKGGKNGGDGDSDDAKPSECGLWDDAMPGPPELVNPAPPASFTLMAPLMSTRSGLASKGIMTAATHSGLGNLSPGSSIRSKQVGGSAMTIRSTGLNGGLSNGLTGGARTMSGLKISK